MRKMKDSGIEWIGEIPEGWETCLYKYCCSVQPGYPFDSAKFSNSSTDGFPLIRIRDITSGEIQTYYTGEYPPNYIVTAGDLLVGMDGDFNVRWWNNDAALLNQRCCRVTEKDSVLRRFLYYVLPFTLQHINTLTYATTVKHLANGDILNSFIAFPSLPAQQNIVHYLDTVCSEIDAMLSKTRSSIEEYKKLKQSVITQAVTKGVRGEREMKDSGVEWVSYIPVDWNTIKLKYCTYIRARLGWRALKADEYVESGFPFLSAFNIVNNALHFTNLNYINQFRYDESPEIQLKVGDVLLVKDGAGIGKCAIVENMPIPSTVNGSIAVISSTSFITPKYLYYYFLSAMFQQHIDLLKDGMGVPHLFQSDLKEIKIAFPSKDEQKEIADYLDAKCAEIDRLIAKKEQLVKELESYKKSLIYEVVTGKREV